MSVAAAAIEPGAVAIAPAGAGDLDAIVALYGQLSAAHGHPVDAAADREKLAAAMAAGQRAVLFRHEGAILGMAAWMDFGDHVFIRNFVLDAAHRRRGLGAALFARLRAEALPEGRPLRLEASAAHSRAFRTRLGFAARSTGMRDDLDPESPR
jgi:GNAT superfamily N-acetyltransferase